jgi:hypothetical protein
MIRCLLDRIQDLALHLIGLDVLGSAATVLSSGEDEASPNVAAKYCPGLSSRKEGPGS